MKWRILFVSSSFHINFSPLPTSQILPLFHLHRFFAFSLHTLCISTAYDEPTPFLPSFCLQAPSSADNSVIVYILIYPLVHIPFSIEAYL